MIADVLYAQEIGKRYVVTYSHPGPGLEGMQRNFGRIGMPPGEVVADVHELEFLGLRFTWCRDRMARSGVRVVRAGRQAPLPQVEASSMTVTSDGEAVEHDVANTVETETVVK
jgi:hypothetical protein